MIDNQLISLGYLNISFPSKIIDSAFFAGDIKGNVDFDRAIAR